MKKFLIIICFLSFIWEIQAQELPNDCIDAIQVCGNGNFRSNSDDFGDVQEVASCGGFEHNSLWLKIDIVQSGELGFDLIPDDPDILVDYDFWVFPANADCSNLGAPIRCATTNPNEAGLSSNWTGIDGSTTVTQTDGGASFEGYVYWLNVLAGESYYIAIDRPHGEGGFELRWTGTAMEGTGAFAGLPEANEIEDQITCSNDPNLGIFNLDVLRSEINSELGNNGVEFFENLEGATDGINALPDIHVTSESEENIYAKVTSLDSDCYNLTEFKLIVQGIPTASVSVNPTATCEGEEVTYSFTGSPNTTVHYQIDATATTGIVLNDSGEATLTDNPMANSTLQLVNVQVIDALGDIKCSTPLTESTFVDVTLATEPLFDPVDDICFGEPLATLPSTSTNGINGTWFPGAMDNTATTTYTFTPDSGQCASIKTMEIVVNALPVIALDSFVVCTASGNGFYAFDLTSQIPDILGSSQNSADFNVSFYEDAALNNIITTNPYTNTTAYNQIIYVEIIDILSDCTSMFPYELTVNEAVANEPAPVIECDYDGNNDGFFAFDLTSLDDEVLSGQDPDVFLVTYHESQEGAENGLDAMPNPELFVNTTAYSQTIFIRVTNMNTPDVCFATTSFDYQVSPILIPVITSESGYNTICVDFGTDAVLNQMTLVSDIRGSNYDYTWYLDGVEINGAKEDRYVITTAAPGLYTLSIQEVQTVANCISDISESFEIIQSGPAEFINVIQTGAFQENPSITVVVNGYGDYWFQLDDGPILDNDGVFDNVSGGFHDVIVYDRKTETPSCDPPLIIEDIRIIDYPKMFTPNNDGSNETWNIFALSDQPNSEIRIYDRYGKFLKQIRPAGQGWNGTFRGERLPSNDYWFVLTYEELGQPKEFRSHFALIR